MSYTECLTRVLLVSFSRADIMIMPISQIRKSKLRQLEQLAQSCTISEWSMKDFEPTSQCSVHTLHCLSTGLEGSLGEKDGKGSLALPQLEKIKTWLWGGIIH